MEPSKFPLTPRKMTLDLFTTSSASAATNLPPTPTIPVIPSPSDMATDLPESGEQTVNLASDEALISTLLVLSSPLRPPIMASCTVLGWLLTLGAAIEATAQEDQTRETADSELFRESMGKSRLWPLAAHLKLMDRQVSHALGSNKTKCVKISSWASRITWLGVIFGGVGFFTYGSLFQSAPAIQPETPAQTTPDLNGLNQPESPVNPPSTVPPRQPVFAAPTPIPDPTPTPAPIRNYSVPLRSL